MAARGVRKKCPEGSEEKMRWGYILCIHPSVYDPSDDTYLILEFFDENPEILKGASVLEIGSGSGIISIHAIALGASRAVSIDISQLACEYTLYNAERALGDLDVAKIDVLRGDAALAMRKGSYFDLIIINPPYLPQEETTGDPLLDSALYGGKSGVEVTASILKSISERIRGNYTILLIHSSITGLNFTLEMMRSLSIRPFIVKERSFFFEKLYLIEGKKIG
jgi:release factor glutamine methyltransferase